MVFVPLPEPDQVSGYAQGRHIFISRTETSGIGLSLPGEAVRPRQPVDLRIAVSNYSRTPFDFSTENISARCGNKIIHVYSPADAVRDEEKRTGAVEPKSAAEPGGGDVEFPRGIDGDGESGNRRLQVFSQSLLRPETVLPHGMHYGVVRVSFPSCVDEVRLSITTGMDIHAFVFELSN